MRELIIVGGLDYDQQRHNTLDPSYYGAKGAD